MTTISCTRFTDDFNWNTTSEYTFGASSSSIDTTNARLTLADATAIYPTGISMSTGHYAFLIQRSTGATDVFNVTIANNAITVTGAGVITIGGIAYTGTALTSPVWVEFVATGTQIAVYSAGVLIGTKTGLTLATSTIQMSRTTANIYVYILALNALESTSASGIAATIGGVPHGARYDTQEEAYFTNTNSANFAELVLATNLKTTNASAENLEIYFANTTDSTEINVDGLTTLDTPLTTTNWTNYIAPILLRDQDRTDTLKFSARRKDYSGVTTDNQPAVLVDYLWLLPIWKV